MNARILCFALVLACSFSCDFENRPWRAYSLTWTCLSADGCERAEQVARLDRVGIQITDDFCWFWSTKDGAFRVYADLVDPGSLPPDCFMMYGFSIFANELDPAQLCRDENGFVMELLIPDRDSPSHSKWRVDGLYTGRTFGPP